MNPHYPHLFEPLVVGKHVFRNRIFSGPNKNKTLTPDGTPGDYMISYYAEKARGGAAQVTVGCACVDPQYGSVPWNGLSLRKPNYPYLNELSFAIHQYGAKASLELDHTGMYARVDEPIGPSDTVREDGVRVTAMTEDLMKRTADQYAQAALGLKICGFDGAFIHGGHGWLLAQFLSPYTNHRTDQYGGSLENRARFPMMVLDAIRSAVGKDFLLEYRISGSELIEGGLTIDQTTEFIRMIQDKINLVHVSAGIDAIKSVTVKTHPTIFLPHCTHAEWAREMKRRVDIPVVSVGAISSPEQAEKLLADGACDVVAMTRSLIADPYLPQKARSGHSEDISPCVRCLQCLSDEEMRKSLTCAVNPTVSREHRIRAEYAVKPQSKRVLVVGGGAAGLKAAATAFDRGHQVILAESSDRLGGILSFTDQDSIKCDLKAQKDYLIRQVEKRNIDVRLNTRVTRENVDEFCAEAIIIAAGSEPVKPPIEGIDGSNVMHVLEAYTRMDEIGRRVILIGGGLGGVETALELGRRGHEVTVIEACKGLAREANRLHGEGMRQEAEKVALRAYEETVVLRIEADGVVIRKKDGQIVTLPAETVLYAVGMRPAQKVYLELYDKAPTVTPVGDCVAPRRSAQAITEGYFAAMNIE